MAIVSITGSTRAIRAAALVFQEAIRVFAPSKAKGLMNIRVYGDAKAFVNAGHHGGKWGWVPINAWMMETPGARHPLFAHGPKGTDGWKRWFDQPQNHFLERGIEAGLPQATKVYGDMRIPEIAKKYGYKYP